MASSNKILSLASRKSLESLPSLLQQTINTTSPRTSTSIIHSWYSVIKKKICSKSLIYPFVAWSLFTMLTMLYFIFV